MQKKNIAVLCGGYSAERTISLGSGEVVCKNLDPDKYAIYKIIVNEQKWILENTEYSIDLDDFSIKINEVHITFDIAFIAIHGTPGEDGKLQGYLDMKKVPYTCCGVITSAVTFNKNYCKSLVKEIDIPLAKGLLLKNDAFRQERTEKIKQQFSFPVFVKPNNNGSSFGIAKVKSSSDLETAITEAYKYDTEVLVEEGLIGTEVTCGVYTFQNEIIVLPICEIVTDKHDFFDYTAKYTQGESEEIIPARISESSTQLVRIYSQKIYQHLGCKGGVRIDFIIVDEIPNMLEVNTVPGISEASIFPKMGKASGLTLKDFFGRLIEEASFGA